MSYFEIPDCETLYNELERDLSMMNDQELYGAGQEFASFFDCVNVMKSKFPVLKDKDKSFHEFVGIVKTDILECARGFNSAHVSFIILHLVRLGQAKARVEFERKLITDNINFSYDG